MTVEVNNLTVEEYLSDERFGPGGKSLSRALEKGEAEDPPSPTAITEAIVGKGRLTGHTLAAGEYAALLEKIKTLYPQSFRVWVEGTISNLVEMKREHTKVFWDRTGENSYPVQLEPYFEQYSLYDQVRDEIHWFDADQR